MSYVLQVHGAGRRLAEDTIWQVLWQIAQVHSIYIPALSHVLRTRVCKLSCHHAQPLIYSHVMAK